MLMPSRLPGLRARRARGFTLIELMIALVLLLLVGAAVVRIIMQQQRFYSGVSGVIETRGSLREVSAILPTELRGVSPSLGDLYAMTDTSIDFRLPSGLSVICQFGATRNIITLPPTSLASHSGLSSWLSTPQLGDTLLVYDEGATSGVSDDSWQVYTVVATPSSGSCPTTTGFTANATEAAGGLTVVISGVLPATVVQGATVRFFRPVHYSLYQPQSGVWYLGYRECPGAVCGTIQPVSGPFLAGTTSSASGLRFVYRDSTGAVTTDRTKVARIDITLRARTRSTVSIPGTSGGYYGDSLMASVAVRDR